MTTFEQAKEEVKTYIADKLIPSIDIDKAAEAYVWAGIEKGDNGEGSMSAEISRMHSRTGNPIAFDFAAVDED